MGVTNIKTKIALSLKLDTNNLELNEMCTNFKML